MKLGTGGEIDMRPDLVFHRDGQDVYVADAKYKLADTGTGRTGDYYQLLAYTTAMSLAEGMLLYCRKSGEAPSRMVVVRNAGKRLWTYPVALQSSADDIAKEISRLADWIAERAAMPGTEHSSTRLERAAGP